MESSIAECVEKQLACELLPTESRQALKLVKCFGHLKRGCECAGSKHIRVKPWFACSRHRVEVAHAPTRYTSGLRIPAGWPSSGVHVPSTSGLCSGCMSQAQSCSEFKLQMLRFVADSALATCRPNPRICTLVHTLSAFRL